MAILVTVLSKDAEALSRYRRIIGAMAERVLPEGNKGEKRIRISANKGLLVAILGRRAHVLTRGNSMLAGLTVSSGEKSSWWNVGGPVPDGSFVMFRSSKLCTEAITDMAGSKTIWHARLRCGGVVTSTCLELIVALLGDYRVDQRALGWFLSSGTCGPRRSWDERIRSLPRNTRLRAQYEGESVTVQERTTDQQSESPSSVEATLLESELSRTLTNCDFGDKPWALALSGGYDSRAMLHGTKHLAHLDCVTWVDESCIGLAKSDLEIARLLAEKAGRQHVVKVIHQPSGAAELESSARRFVRYSDGRVDNFFAYIDGMQMWDELYQSEYAGLLRGDELFGSTFATNTSQILHNMRLESFSDFAGGIEQRELAVRYNHGTPPGLSKRPGESIGRWRWRLRADFEIPVVYAALNAIRSRFIESTCPLLVRNLVDMAASMSDDDLENRKLYKQVVGRMFADIPFATQPSVVNRSAFLAISSTIELLLDHSQSTDSRDVLGQRCSRKVAAELEKIRNASSVFSLRNGMSATKRALSPDWAKRLRKRLEPPPSLHFPTLGMRCYLARLVREEMTAAATIGAREAYDIKQAIA
jgi:hypothetical protein